MPEANPTAGPGLSRRQRYRLWLVFLLVLAPLVLGSRWGWSHRHFGPALQPRPDAIEYAAGAQSLVDSGRYYLQVGPVEAQPRYPPGWSFVLAGAVAFGVPGAELWRVTTLFGVALAWLLAVAAAELVALLPGSSALAAGVGGTVAGWAWATSPNATLTGQVVMSDEPAVLGTVLVVLGALAVASSPRRPGLAFGVGLVAGWLAITRSVAVVLLAAPLAVALAPWLRRWERCEILRVALFAGAGAAVPLAVAGWVLHLSGFPPFPFSAYGFWVPEWFGEPFRAFSWRYALFGNPEVPIHGRPPASHLATGLNWVLGLRGFQAWTYPARLWPPIALLAGLVLARRYGKEPRVRAGAMAALLWIGLTLAFYSLYFYAQGRFYLSVAALEAVLLGCGAGWVATSLRAPSMRGVGVAVLALWALLVFELQRRAHPRVRRAYSHRATEAAVVDWLSWSTERRRSEIGAFDPVLAQALGLFPCATVRSIELWGRLGLPEHVGRLGVALEVPYDQPLPAAPTHPRAHGSWCDGGGSTAP